MMDEEAGAEFSATRDAQGNIREADTPAAPAVDLNALASKVSTDLAFQTALKRTTFRFLDYLGTISGDLKTAGEHKVNMVCKIADTGDIAVLTDAAINGKKVTDLSAAPNKDYPVVAFIDLPLIVKTSPLPGGGRVVVSFRAPSGVTFRPLPNKA